jgi:folate-binding protein YgfZ
MDTEVLAQYHALSADHDGCGFVPLSDSSVIEFRGDDRDRFLHNFCTADVKALAVNKTCEAFFLNPKGKTIAHGFISKLPDALLVWTIDAKANELIEFLDRYLLSEKVEIELQTEKWNKYFLAGKDASPTVQKVFGNTVQQGANLQSTTPLESIVAGLEAAGQGFLVLVIDGESFEAAVVEAGATKCSIEALSSIRLEQKTPWSGIEIDESNLPQEIGRDQQAISFEKGCYLGQETVARLDAMGHVNQRMVGFQFSTDSSIKPGDAFEFEGKTIGRVTSVAWSPKHKTNIGLGFVRRKFSKPGTEIQHGEEVVTVS